MTLFTVLKCTQLIIHSEVPERDDDSMPRLDIVLYDTSVFYILYLLLTFLPSANLKGIVTNGKVGNPGGNNILFFSHLIVEESFPYVSNIGIRVEYRHQAWVIDIDFFYLSKIAHSRSIISEQTYHSCTF